MQACFTCVGWPGMDPNPDLNRVLVVRLFDLLNFGDHIHGHADHSRGMVRRPVVTSNHHISVADCLDLGKTRVSAV